MAHLPAMDDAATANAWRATVRKRVVATGVVFVLWALGIEARLVYLQVFRHDALAAKAADQRQRIIPVPGRRGGIVDRDGRVLAMNVAGASVYAVPKVVVDDAESIIGGLCSALDDCDSASRDKMIEQVRVCSKNPKRSAFLFLKRQVTPQEAQRVLGLNLKGINLYTESRRLYPNRELAAHLLGWVGTDGKGLAGIEATYDKDIRGRGGRLFIEIDNKRNTYGRIEEPPTAGATIELTIAEPLQYIAEAELRAVVKAHNPVGGTIIIMDPWTGEVLALANEPTFNPNIRVKDRNAELDLRRNRAAQEIYEPGSTFKVVTASAAIEEHAFTPEEPIDVSDGFIRLPGRVVKDVHRYGVLSFSDVIVKSSNVGAIKVGTRLGTERMNRYVRRFGFGSRLCPDLPGESAGMLQDPATWSANSLASISMGYEIGVTPLQMATAVSSVANGGSLIQPRVVHGIRTAGTHSVVEPLVLRKTIDPATVAELTRIMELVVIDGTGKQAKVPGFTVAGKTGTAAKNFPGRGYSDTDYHASFVGFVPSRRPALTILVVIDTPRGPGYPTRHKYYGGDIAAPVFARVAEQALRYLAIAPTVDPVPPVLLTDTLPARSGAVTPAAVADLAPHVDALTGVPTIPELRGLSAREAIMRLARVGLTAHVSGTGFVTAQEPAAGTPIDNRSTCSLTLGRTPVSPAVAQQ